LTRILSEFGPCKEIPNINLLSGVSLMNLEEMNTFVLSPNTIENSEDTND